MESLPNGIQADSITGARWIKSSASNPNGECVEIARVGDEFAMRNSRDPQGPALVYTRAEIAAFVEGARRGDFDFPTD